MFTDAPALSMQNALARPTSQRKARSPPPSLVFPPVTIVFPGDPPKAKPNDGARGRSTFKTNTPPRKANPRASYPRRTASAAEEHDITSDNPGWETDWDSEHEDTITGPPPTAVTVTSLDSHLSTDFSLHPMCGRKKAGDHVYPPRRFSEEDSDPDFDITVQAPTPGFDPEGTDNDVLIVSIAKRTDSDVYQQVPVKRCIIGRTHRSQHANEVDEANVSGCMIV
jgi:hypothetical protein